MTKEHNAFEEHCRASETYKTVKLDLYAEKQRWISYLSQVENLLNLQIFINFRHI